VINAGALTLLDARQGAFRILVRRKSAFVVSYGCRQQTRMSGVGRLRCSTIQSLVFTRRSQAGHFGTVAIPRPQFP